MASEVRIGNVRHLYSAASIKKLRGAKFACLNICSITNKLDDISALLHNSGLGYLGVCETWLTDMTSMKELQIVGYTISRNDRDAGSSKRLDGGVMVYSRNHHCFDELG